MIRWVMSFLFVVQMYFMLGVIGIGMLPLALWSRQGARFVCRSFAWWVCMSARVMVGLRTEVRGTVPTGEVIIAAKHQSFLDILMIFGAVPRGKFIMKRELLWTPVVGFYGMRIGCVPVARGKRGHAIAKMARDVARGASDPGQLIIYPQGTRVAPGVKQGYKVGAAVLYEQSGQTCVPVATNVGVFWPRTGIYRKPGLAVVEFLEPIPPGLSKEAFLKQLEKQIEPASNALMKEGGFDADAQHG